MLSRILDILTDSKSAAALLGAIVSSTVLQHFADYVIGELTLAWFVLLLVVLDTVLGLVLAYRGHKISSLKFSRVFDKLLVYFCLLSATFALERVLANSVFIAVANETRSVVVMFMVLRELISIIEKAAKFGVAVPEWVKSKLEETTSNDQSKR